LGSLCTKDKGLKIYSANKIPESLYSIMWNNIEIIEL